MMDLTERLCPLLTLCCQMFITITFGSQFPAKEAHSCNLLLEHHSASAASERITPDGAASMVGQLMQARSLGFIKKGRMNDNDIHDTIIIFYKFSPNL